jgi:hypothetical protein
MAAPDLFIIGAPKCGTSSLFDVLASSPDVTATLVKEPAVLAGAAYDDDFLPDTSLYDGLFPEQAGRTRYHLEGSAFYLAGGRRVAEALRSVQPEPTCLAILRDPVARFWAHFDHVRAKREIEAGTSPAAYYEACRAYLSRTGSDKYDHRADRGLDGGQYGSQLGAWAQVLGADPGQERTPTALLTVISFEWLVEDPASALDALWRRLSLRGTPPRQLPHSNRNVGRRGRLWRMAKTAHGSIRRASPRLALSLQSRLGPALRGRGRAQGLPPVAPDVVAAVSTSVRDFYRPDMDRLRRLIGSGRVPVLGEPPRWLDDSSDPR